MTREQQLKSIFDNDPFGLLALKPKTNQRNADERLVAGFQAIVDFYEENSKEPEFSKINIQECQLYYELKALRLNNDKCKALKDLDIYGLLESKETEKPISKKEFSSIEDILNDDAFGILDTDESIFEITHVNPTTVREAADFVAKRKKCKNFHKYESLFQQCHLDLKAGNRKLIKFSEDDIQKGTFFIVDGILAYIENMEKVKKDRYGKRDGRINCIFENGTESNLLFRSLGKALYKNGQSVTESSKNTTLLFQPIDTLDLETGFIYILKSKSTNPAILSIPNLYKIGFSTTPVEERIKNALQEPTYLMADVQIITTYKCYNINPQKFENFIHSFFSKVCLSIDIYDTQRNRHIPREWFSVPLHIIDETIQLIISANIKGLRYDDENEKLVKD
jgi:hypothetical protein